jgi:hypothetical protein
MIWYSTCIGFASQTLKEMKNSVCFFGKLLITTLIHSRLTMTAY